MKQESKQVTLRTLTPEEGYLLTQAGKIEITQRTFSDLIYLGCNDDPANYTEWSMADVDAFKIKQEEAAKEEYEKQLKQEQEQQPADPQ